MLFGGSKKLQGPGEILRVEVPLTLSVVLVIAVTLLTISYALWVDARPTIWFLITATGIAAGVLSAYYIGRALAVTIEQRDRGLTDEKIARAFAFAHRWNDPTFAQLRADWRMLLHELAKEKPERVCEILEPDLRKRTVVTDVLNFFEEMGYAARNGVANQETLRNIFRRIVENYFSIIQPWIVHRRRERDHPTLYEHFEWLRNEWRAT